MNSAQRQESVVRPRHVKLRYFSIVLVPISFFWLNDAIISNFIADSLEVPSDILQDGRDWLEATGRYRFLAATWFFVSLTVLAVALLVCNLARPTDRETRAAAIATLLIILSLALISTIQHITEPDGPRVYRHLGTAVFETALSRGNLPGCTEPGDRWLLGQCGDLPVIGMFNRVMDIVNGVAGLGIGALIVGMILCLETRESDTVEEGAALLAENLRQMRQQLYLSSLVLTFGMFFATSWMHWPLPMVLETERAAYSSVVLAAGLFTGTYFSLLILSFFLPVAIILDGRVRRLAEMAGGNFQEKEQLDVDKWMASQGLKGGATDYLRAGFAITAPIFAAFAGGISPVVL